MDKKPRISLAMAAFLVGAALLVDITQVIVDLTNAWTLGWLINPLFNILMTGVFWLWLYLLGVKMQSKKRIFAFLGMPIIDSLPLVGDFFTWTLGIIITIVFTYKEDWSKSKSSSLSLPKLKK